MIKIKRGLNLPISGAPKQTIEDGPSVRTVAVLGSDYVGMKPTMLVKVGDQVDEGQTVLIIEAMKTMNQIPSPKAGTVRQILVANAEPVEFGHPLMIID